LKHCLTPATSRFGSRADVAALLFALLFPSFGTWLYFVALSGTPWMQPLYTALKIVQFAFPVAWLWGRCNLRTMFATSKEGMLAGLGFGIVTAAAIVLLYHGVLKGSAAFSQFPERLREKLEGFRATTIASYLVLGVFISLIHSFLEEYYWRWFAHGQLRRWFGFGTAALISSVGFMAHHVLVLGAYIAPQYWYVIMLFSVGVATGGAFWAWLFERSGGVLAPWLSHLLIDAALIYIGFDQVWGSQPR
jgi:uncharacterized protein